MKYLFLLVGLYFLSVNVFCAENNNFKGKMSAGLNASGGHSTASGWEYHIRPRYQYYVLDKFSFGADLEFNKSGNQKRIGFGPSANFTFIRLESWAFMITQNLLYSKEDNQTPGFIGTSGVVTNYFLKSNFSLGLFFGEVYSISKGKAPDASLLQGAVSYYF